MRLIRHLSSAVTLCVALVACNGPQIITDRDPSIPIPRKATYAWREPGPVELDGEAVPELQNPILQARIRRQIDLALADKGFVRTTDSSAAQLLVHYHVGLHSKQETVTSARPPRYGYSAGLVCWRRYCGTDWRWGFYGPPEYESRTYEYREGSLLIDVEQRNPPKLAWRAIASDRVDKNSGTEESVQKYVRETLASLPPAQ